MDIITSLRWLGRMKSCCLLLFILILLLVLGACTALGWGLGRAFAATPEPVDVLVVVDQSNSLWELGGVGSDPEGWRIHALELLAAYLGVDDNSNIYQLGVIYFGTQPRVVLPLTPLTGEAVRTDIQNAIGSPEPMGWSDVSAALELAGETLLADGGSRRQLLVLLTDGRPETEGPTTPEARAEYLEGLAARVRDLAQRGVELHIVLLSNAATDADPDIQKLYRPLWQRLEHDLTPVTLHELDASEDLPALYHDLMVQLHRLPTAETVVQTNVVDQVVRTITVEPGLERLTVVVYHSGLETQARLYGPGAAPLKSAEGSRVHVWTFDRPRPGRWQIQVTGAGQVWVWKDARPLPPTSTATATATATVAPSPTPTRAPTGTPTLTATPTPTSTPTPTPIYIPTSTTIPTPSPTVVVAKGEWPVWPWAILGIGLTGGTLAGVVWWKRRGPYPTGALRLVRAPQAGEVGQRWDLDRLRQRRVLIGRDPECAVHLMDSGETDLRLAHLEADAQGTLVVPLDGVLLLNSDPIRRPSRLYDGDRLSCGLYTLRYENLQAIRRRRSTRL